MDIPTKEGTFKYNLKRVIIKMLELDPNYEIFSTENAISELKDNGQTLKDYIAANPKLFGEAVTSVTFDFMGGEDLEGLF